LFFIAIILAIDREAITLNYLMASADGLVDSVFSRLAKYADVDKLDGILTVERSALVAHGAELAGISCEGGQ
jgi:hypothetical protein